MSDLPLAAIGAVVTVGNPWWRKGVSTPCVIREVSRCSPHVTVEPLEGHPHIRFIACVDPGVRWPGKPARYNIQFTADTDMEAFHAAMHRQFSKIINRQQLYCFEDERTPALEELLTKYNVKLEQTDW